MNHIISILSILLFVITPFKCSSDDSETVEDPILELTSENTIQIPAEGGSEEITFTTNGDWTITADSDWVSVLSRTGVAGDTAVTIQVAANENPDVRIATVSITTKALEQAVTIMQEGMPKVEEEKYFTINQTHFDISHEETDVFVNVRTNVEYEYHIVDSDWITDKTENVASGNLKFLVAANDNSESRIGTISVCASTGQCYAVTIVQDGYPAPANTDWLERDIYHRSLVMRFTATWCGYCPNMNTAIENAMSKYPDKIEYVALHGTSSNLYFNGTNALMSQFDINGFPTGIMDARATIENYASSIITNMIKDVLDETEKAYPTTTGLSISSSIQGSELTVKVNMYAKEADSYKVTVLLLEDDIVGYQAGASENYYHIRVAREALTNIKGDDATVADPKIPWEKTFTLNIPTSYNKSNLRILAYVQKPYGSQTIVKGVSSVKYGNFGDLYVDNAASAKVGTTMELKYVD